MQQLGHEIGAHGRDQNQIGLARQIALDYGATWGQQHEMLYKEALLVAQQANPEVSDAYFEPGRE